MFHFFKNNFNINYYTSIAINYKTYSYWFITLYKIFRKFSKINLYKITGEFL